MKILGPSLIISVQEIHLSNKHNCLPSLLVAKMTHLRRLENIVGYFDFCALVNERQFLFLLALII